MAKQISWYYHKALSQAKAGSYVHKDYIREPPWFYSTVTDFARLRG